MTGKPNILLITADQMRWDFLGCAGADFVKTPNLDALARRGVNFKNAFTPNPICVPARASIMTGNYPHVCTGNKNNGGKIREDQPLLTDVLQGAGYRTYAFGKLHFVPYAPPGTPRLVHGFEHVDLTESGRILAQFDPGGKLSGVEDYFDYLKTVGWHGYSRAHGVGNNDVRPCPTPLPAEHAVDSWIADCTVRQIERHRKDFPHQPFFMWMSSPKPHSPYDPPAPWDRRYDPRSMPAPAKSETGTGCMNPILERTRITHAIDTLSPQAIATIRAYYAGSVSFLDAMIGRVFDKLEKAGLLDNTLIVFTADHGDLLGDFGSFFKSNHMNGSVRVPFIAAGPGVGAGRTSPALVGLQDILPTFAAFAGADIGEPVHGLDLSRLFSGEEERVRDCYYSQTLESPWQSAMITDGKIKYVYSEANATEELYDQEHDPYETVNLAADPVHAGRLADMRALLTTEAADLGDTALFENGELKISRIDREEIAKLPVSGMGWRWY